MRFILAILILLFYVSIPASAEIYKCTDENGEITFTTKPGPGCTLLPGSVDKSQYDFTCRKSVSSDGMTCYAFKRLKAPRITLLPNKTGISYSSELNDILRNIGEPEVDMYAPYHSAKNLRFIWDNYKDGFLVIDVGKCKYMADDKDEYTCIKTLCLMPKEIIIAYQGSKQTKRPSLAKINPIGAIPRKRAIRDLKIKLAKRYKDSYSLQKMLLDSGMEAYDKLRRLPPNNVNNKILYRLKSRYYPSFSLILMLYESEIESYKDLQRQ